MSNNSNFSQKFPEKTILTPDADNETPTSKNDGTFFKELTKDFYNRLINTINSFDDFENLSIEWIKSTLEHNDMNAETFLESIQNHQILFSSLIGFFYQHGIGCNVNKDKALEMYLFAIMQDKDQIFNNTIAKYLLSLFYYKDIILSNKVIIGLPININPLKNEIIKINPDEKAKYEQYVISARRGNNIAQYNLGCCYDFGKGINKDKKKAFEWYLKSAEAGNNDAQLYLGYCYRDGEGINKDEKKAFEWFLKSSKAGNITAQYNLG